MLSRVADSIYWLGRYIERAENVARAIDVNLQLQLDLPGEERPWEPVIQTAGNADAFFKSYAHVSTENALTFLTFDKENPSSIISCVAAARENARCVRERISSELWIAINQFYLKLNDPEVQKQALAAPHAFYCSVKEFSQLTVGIIQGTMTHDVAWNFARLGTMIERADQTSRILDVKYYILLPDVSMVGMAMDTGTTIGALFGSRTLYDNLNRQLYRLDAITYAGKNALTKTSSLLDTLNPSVPPLLNRVDGMTSDLASMVTDFKPLPQKVDTLLANVDGLMGSVDSTMGRVGGILNDVTQMVSGLGDFVETAEGTLQNADDLMDGLSNMWLIRRSMPKKDSVPFMVETLW